MHFASLFSCIRPKLLSENILKQVPPEPGRESSYAPHKTVRQKILRAHESRIPSFVVVNLPSTPGNLRRRPGNHQLTKVRSLTSPQNSIGTQSNAMKLIKISGSWNFFRQLEAIWFLDMIGHV